MIRKRAFAAMMAIALGILPACACARECVPQVHEGWVRLPPMPMPMLAGFARIENRCAAAAVIVGVSSPAFADASLHETRIVDGVSRMRAVPELRIARDGAARLKPGGLHLMLMQPRARLKPGSKVMMEFALKGGGSLRGEFVVRAPGE